MKEHRAAERKLLNGGAPRSLSLKDTLTMRWYGRRDGRSGLPQEEDGVWTSPRLKQELDAYAQFCARIWGTEQVTLEQVQIQAGSLIDRILHSEAQLESKKRRCPPEPPTGGSNERRTGEEGLSESQIRARRSKEAAKKLTAYHAELKGLESDIRSCVYRLIDLRNRILESNHVARLVCHCMLSCVEQRIDVYWGAALKVHPARDKMPTLPVYTVSCDAEAVYMKRHRSAEKTISEVIEHYRNLYPAAQTAQEAA